jgi:hypothetical protein
MTELLRRWVNDEIKVSRTVKNFDTDFCNGYLFLFHGLRIRRSLLRTAQPASTEP